VPATSVLQPLQHHYDGRMDGLALDDVKLFARVAALGTLSAAARERDVPVSQVSRALSRLEKVCGARLIHRSTHGLALTGEGEAFLGYCERLIGTLDEMEGDFARKSQEAAGRVRVAASSVLAQYLLVPSLSALQDKHPRLSIELEVSDRLADMARDAIDIAIRTGTALPETTVARRIGSLGRGLYAAPAYAERAGLPTHPDQLGAHRLIANSAAPHLNHWPFVVDGRKTTVTVEGAWRSNDTAVAASMVLQGLGIGRLGTVPGEKLVRQGRLVRVLDAFVEHEPVPIYAVIASTRQRLPKIKACIDHWAEWLAVAGTDQSSNSAR
jgi:DNA-binding transcriptional LysR family regulator